MKQMHFESTPKDRHEAVHVRYMEAQQKQFARVRRNVTRLWIVCALGLLLNIGVAIWGAMHGDLVQFIGATLVMGLCIFALIGIREWLDRNRDRIS